MSGFWYDDALQRYVVAYCEREQSRLLIRAAERRMAEERYGVETALAAPYRPIKRVEPNGAGPYEIFLNDRKEIIVRRIS